MTVIVCELTAIAKTGVFTIPFFQRVRQFLLCIWHVSVNKALLTAEQQLPVGKGEQLAQSLVLGLHRKGLMFGVRENDADTLGTQNLLMIRVQAP